MQSMPLIGVKGEKRVFTFHAATGFLKVKVAQLNTTLDHVELYAPGKKLNGTFALSGEAGAEYLAMTETTTADEQKLTLNYTDLEGLDEATFILPVTVGTLPVGATITLRNAAGENIGSVELAEELAIERNVMADAGTLEMAANYGAALTYSGDAAAIKVGVDIIRSATSVKMVLANTEEAAVALLAAGTDRAIATLTEDGEVTLDASAVSKSGPCVLVVKTFAGETEKETYVKELKCLKSADAALLCKQFLTKSDDTGYEGSYTFAASKDFENYNLELVEFDGMTPAGEAVELTHRIFTTLYWLKDNPAKWCGSATPAFGAGTVPAIVYDGGNYISFTVGSGDGEEDNNLPFFYYGGAQVVLYTTSKAKTGSETTFGDNYPAHIRFSISGSYVDVNDTFVCARFHNPDVSGGHASGQYALNVRCK